MSRRLLRCRCCMWEGSRDYTVSVWKGYIDWVWSGGLRAGFEAVLTDTGYWMYLEERGVVGQEVWYGGLLRFESII